MSVTKSALSRVLAAACALATVLHAQGVVPPTGVISGRVIDAATGDPIPDVLVGPAAVMTSTVGRFGATVASTDAQGRFLLRNLPKGAVTIRATSAGYLQGAYGQGRPGGQYSTITLAEGARVSDLVITLFKYCTVSGMVVDEAGEPVVDASVKAYRYAFVGGQRRLYSSFSGTSDDRGVEGATDDRGVYRITSLQPGDYVFAIVSAPTTAPAAGATRGAMIGDLRFSANSDAFPPAASDDGRVQVYPTTFYPSSPISSSASVVTLSAGENKTGIDFHLAPVRALRVSGTVSGPDGPEAGLTISLAPTDVDRFNAPDVIGVPTARTSPTGAFTFLGITPGAYTLKATKIPKRAAPPDVVTEMPGRGMTVRPGNPLDAPTPTAPALSAAVPVSVSDEDISGVTVQLQPGGRVLGHVEFDGVAEKPTPQVFTRTFIFIEPEFGALESGPMDQFFLATIDAKGNIASPSVPRGRYFIRQGFGMPEPWVVKSAMVGGRDAFDTVVEIGGPDLAMVLTYTDRPARVTGTVRDERNQISADSSAVLFPVDRRMWTSYGLRPRVIASVRAGRDGVYQMSGMPAGDYYLAALKERDMGAWQDPAVLAALSVVADRITITAGETTTHDVKTTVIK